MKSRREILSGMFIDIAKAVFLAIVLGKVINNDLVNWIVIICAILFTLLFTFMAIKIHPGNEQDKELNKWI